jgi:hypothetical protein
MRARNYLKWLELQQAWRDSGKVSVPDSKLADNIRQCMIDLLREVCANTDLDTPYEALFQLADQLETLHCGSKATYLLPNRFNTSLKGDPTYKTLRSTAVGFISQYPDGSADQASARKTVQDAYAIAEQTVSKWVVEMKGSDIVGSEIDERILRFSGSLYRDMRLEAKERIEALKQEDFSAPHT